MKKSNKILLGIFLTAFLILGGIHVSLMAKYKSGAFTAFQEDLYQDFAVKPLAKNSQIYLENIDMVLLVLSDTPRLKYDKEETTLTITEKGGILTIAGPERNDGNDNGIQVQLLVDSSIMVALKNSNANIKENGGTNQVLKLTLDNSRFGAPEYSEPDPVSISGLNIVATNESRLNLKQLHVGQLTINLQKSFLNESNSTIQQFVLEADDSSHISLSSANFLKITKTSINE